MRKEVRLTLAVPVSAAARGDAKRAAILAAAKRAFLEWGFEGTSMDAVAARAGVSKMTVYRHFGSKEDLFAALIGDLCEHIVDDRLNDALKRPPAQALRRYARQIIDTVFAPETVALHRIVISESRRFPMLGRLFYQSGPQTCISALAQYFTRNKGHDGLNVADPRRAAEEFLELLRGYAHLRLLLGIDKAPSRREIDARIESAVRHVLGESAAKGSTRRAVKS